MSTRRPYTVEPPLKTALKFTRGATTAAHVAIIQHARRADVDRELAMAVRALMAAARRLERAAAKRRGDD